jgi:hypothetical protein
MNLRSLPPIALLLFAAGARAQLSAPPPMPANAPAQVPAQASAPTKAPLETDEPADLPPAHKTAADTRIEQRRQGNRIVEVTVTPAGTTRSYTIVNREGQRPLSVQELSAGLSTPRFFKLDF